MGLRSYIEYPPSYCSGILYVNTFAGRTVALDSHNGHRIWQRFGAKKPSTPAIAGGRLIVSSHDGRVTAYNRFNGQLLWRLKVNAKIESSPVAIGRVVYFGATDGRLFAVYVRTGRVKWAYDTGGRINSSPSISGNRIFVSTYAGSIFAFARATATSSGTGTSAATCSATRASTRARRPTDGACSRSPAQGRSMPSPRAAATSSGLRGSEGWAIPRRRSPTAACSSAGSTEACALFAPSSGQLLWRRNLHGRILGGSFVAGNLVFTSTLAARTFALRVSRRQDPLAAGHREVLTGDRHRTPLLLHAERNRDGVARTPEPADPRAPPRQATTGGKEEVSAGAGDDGAIEANAAARSWPPARPRPARRTTHA